MKSANENSSAGSEFGVFTRDYWALGHSSSPNPVAAWWGRPKRVSNRTDAPVSRALEYS